MILDENRYYFKDNTLNIENDYSISIKGIIKLSKNEEYLKALVNNFVRFVRYA